MPTEFTPEKLASSLKTKQAWDELKKELGILQSQNLTGSNQVLGDVQKLYPTLYLVLTSFGRQLDTVLNQTTVQELLAQVNKLEEVTVNIAPTMLGHADTENVANVSNPNEPNGLDHQAELADWIQTNINPHAVLNCVESNDLISGVKLIYRGWYKDYSLNKVISEKLLKLLPNKDFV